MFNSLLSVGATIGIILGIVVVLVLVMIILVEGQIPQVWNRLCLTDQQPALGGAVLTQGQRETYGPERLRSQ